MWGRHLSSLPTATRTLPLTEPRRIHIPQSQLVPACSWVATDGPSTGLRHGGRAQESKSSCQNDCRKFHSCVLSCRLDQGQCTIYSTAPNHDTSLQVVIVSENRYRFRRACCSSLCERCRIKFEVTSRCSAFCCRCNLRHSLVQ
jgi:hypothetical protein